MKTHTETAVAAILSADETISGEQVKSAMEAVRAVVAGQSLASAESKRPIGRVLKVADVAALFGVSKRTVGAWRRSGKLRPVNIPGRRYALGYCEDDIRAIMAGEVAGNQAGATGNHCGTAEG